MNFFTKYSSGITVLILGVLLFFLTGLNHGCGGIKTVSSDTTRIHDTIYRTKDSLISVYQPPIVIPGKPQVIVIPTVDKPSNNYDSLLGQYNDILNKFLTTNVYNDSIKLYDNSNTKVGTVRINDDVSENKIQKRNTSYNLNIPYIHDSVTITNTVVKTNLQVYWGVGLTGSTKKYVNGGNLGLILRDAKENMFGMKVGAMYLNSKIEPQFEVSKYFKIKLKK